MNPTPFHMLWCFVGLEIPFLNHETWGLVEALRALVSMSLEDCNSRHPVKISGPRAVAGRKLSVSDLISASGGAEHRAHRPGCFGQACSEQGAAGWVVKFGI